MRKVGISLCVGVLLILTTGCGVQTTKKTAFSAAKSRSSFTEFQYVWMDNVWGGKSRWDVRVKPTDENSAYVILVKVDTNSAGTAITVVPRFAAIMYPPPIFVDAESVTIWVPTEEERIAWEEWAKKSIEANLERLRERKTAPPLQRINPPPFER